MTKKSLTKKFLEDLKTRPLTEEEQGKFSRLNYNQNFCSAGEIEAIFKKLMSMEESEFDKMAGYVMDLFEGFYSSLEEAIDAFRKHHDNVNVSLKDYHGAPQDSYFYEMADFLSAGVHIIEQSQDFSLSTK